jgi:spore maturation protein CgeB
MSRASTPRFLVLDGIGGVPLGREIAASLQTEGCIATHIDCLEQPVRKLHKIRSAYAKAIDRWHHGDSFHFLPRLAPECLRNLVEAEKPSHILVVGFIYKFFDPQALRQLADEYRAALLLYDTDSCNLYDKRREFIFFIEKELSIYDKIHSFSQVTTRFFTGTRNLPASYLPFGAMPHPLAETTDKTIDALFVGSCDLRRIFLLENIREHVTVFGNRWRRNYPLISRELQTKITDRPVWGDELQGFLARSKIVLNITRTDFFGTETGINLRIFEALAAGCFLLTDSCNELEDLFVIGKEIETFRSSRELEDKVRFYLENDVERAAIAKRGHERFLQSHTWRDRIRQMLATPVSNLTENE